MENVVNKTERISDPRLKNVFLPLPTTFRGSPTVINHHPKEATKIIYCSGKLVIVRDLVNSQQYLVYRGHNDRTTVATFAPNGYWIASGDCTGKIRIWSYDHPEHILKLELMVFNGEVKDIQWDPESRRIVVVGDGKGSFARAFVWDTGNSLGEIVGPQKRILSVDYKPTRPFRIATGSEDFNVCFFEGPPFKFKRNLTGFHTNFVNCVRYSPNGEYFIAASSDKSISLYDGKEGEFITKLPVEHQASVYSVSWNPEGTKVLSASADKKLKIWNVQSKNAPSEVTVNINTNPTVQDMQVASLWLNKDLAISLSLSGSLNVFDAKNFTSPMEIIQGHQVNLLALDIAHKLGVVFTGSYDGATCIWDIHTGKAKRINNGHNGKICQIAANETYMTSVGWDDKLRIFPLMNATLCDDNCKYETVVSLDCQPNGLCMPLNNDNLQVVSTNNGLLVISDGNIVFTKNTSSKWSPKCVAISRDGRSVAVGSDDSNKIYLYSLNHASGELTEIGILVGHLGQPVCMSYSPNNRYLVVGDTYREVRVWDIEKKTEKIKSLWVYHTTTVTSVDWSPNGKYIVSGSLDEYMYIWNIDDPMTRQKYEFAHKDGVTGVRFYDENMLFSIGNDGCVNQWKVESQ